MKTSDKEFKWARKLRMIGQIDEENNGGKFLWYRLRWWNPLLWIIAALGIIVCFLLTDKEGCLNFIDSLKCKRLFVVDYDRE